jgi:hypothetical protein
MPLTAERQQRICEALKQNLQQWITQLEAIEADTAQGAKGPILHLLANMAQASATISRILRDDDAPALDLNRPRALTTYRSNVA